ncbi:hypothetical protein [Mangrovibacter phragmitis]|nr:hypothetical protein [Mangrovibacter phragmitis]
MLADRLAVYAPAFTPARLPTGWHRLEGAILTWETAAQTTSPA